MKNSKLVRFGLIGGGALALIGTFGVIAVQGIWAATQTPGAFITVMFGA